MEPAASIIKKLGGPSAVAEIARVHRTRVSNWQRPKDAGGTGGIIPQRHIVALMEAAEKCGINLEYSDFFGKQPEETQ